MFSFPFAFRAPPPSQSIAATPAGELFALDRSLPLGALWCGLARFRGRSRAVTRWIARSVAPRLARQAVARWRVPGAVVLAENAPFLLCLARGEPREGLRLLLAEWMEFRRLVPESRWRLVVRTSASSPDQPAFEAAAPFWEQTQALKRQLGVRRSEIYLWLRAEDDAGDEQLLDAAGALIVVARNQTFGDPLALALRKCKPVLAPRVPDDESLPGDYPFQFATRPAVVRFVGEPRRKDTASVTWPIPEPHAIAETIRTATADPVALIAAGKWVGSLWQQRKKREADPIIAAGYNPTTAVR